MTTPALGGAATVGAHRHTERRSRAPFPGLEPFREADEPFFFGREAERRTIADNLIASRLTLLYGPSGVGKSSILRAGVVPNLQASAARAAEASDRAGLDHLVVVVDRWSGDPINELLAGIAAAADAARTAATEAGLSLEIPTAPLGGTMTAQLKAWTRALRGQLLIILDQFEEYFLYHADQSGEGTFDAEFPRAVNDRTLKANFLISIREDALARLDRFKGRIPNPFENRLRLGYLSPRSARTAVVMPVRRYNLMRASGAPRASIERALISEVLESVPAGVSLVDRIGRGIGEVKSSESRPIEAPYLQLVMARLWEREMLEAPNGQAAPVSSAGQRTLRLATLQHLGGARQIVQSHLDRTMSVLSAEQCAIAASVFEHLVTPSGSKIAHTAADLAAYASVTTADLDPVLTRLSERHVRVLREIVEPGDARPARYEIYHDVLAAAILEWRREFEATKEREGERTALRRRLYRFTTVAGLVVAAIIGGFFYYTSQLRREANISRSSEYALTSLVGLKKDPAGSLRLALKADSLRPSRLSDSALRGWLESQSLGVLRPRVTRSSVYLAFSPSGKFLTAYTPFSINAWSTRSWGAIDSSVIGRETNLIAFSPDDEHFVALSDSVMTFGDTRSWSARVLDRSGLRIARFSPDGSLLAGLLDSAVAIWDGATGRVVTTLPVSATSNMDGRVDLRFDRTGSRLFLVGRRSVVAWRVSDWARYPTRRIRPRPGFMQLQATLDLDAKYLVSVQDTVNDDTTVYVTTVMRMPADFGTRLLSPVFTTRGRIANIVPGADLAVLEHRDSLQMVRLPSGDRVGQPHRSEGMFSSDSGGFVFFWRTEPVRESAVSERTGSDQPERVRARADSAVQMFLLAVPSSAGTIPDPVRLVGAAPCADVMDVKFSADERLVAIACRNGVPTVWNTRTGALVSAIEGHPGVPRSMLFSQDDSLLITYADSAVRVWSVRSRKCPACGRGTLLTRVRAEMGRLLPDSVETIKASPITAAPERRRPKS